jgi:hypothetical protein
VAKKKSAAGRPTKFDPKRLEEIKNYCLLGARDQDLADFLGVSLSCIQKWKNEYPEFLHTIKEGKEIADAKVAQSLFHRAIGYEHDDVDIRTVSVGKGCSEIVETPIVKKYPPDPTSMIFWLKNRNKENWRERQEIDHTTGGEKITTIDPKQLSTQALKEILKAKKNAESE